MAAVQQVGFVILVARGEPERIGRGDWLPRQEQFAERAVVILRAGFPIRSIHQGDQVCAAVEGGEVG